MIDEALHRSIYPRCKFCECRFEFDPWVVETKKGLIPSIPSVESQENQRLQATVACEHREQEPPSGCLGQQPLHKTPAFPSTPARSNWSPLEAAGIVPQTATGKPQSHPLPGTVARKACESELARR